MKTLYRDLKALQIAITVLRSKIQPNSDPKWPGLTYIPDKTKLGVESSTC